VYVGCYGFLNFVGHGGQKGAIFNTILMLLLLLASYRSVWNRSVWIGFIAAGTALYLLLPAMNAFKEAASGPVGGLREKVDLLRSEDYFRIGEEQVMKEGNLSDLWLEYGLQRITLISMPHAYVNAYWGHGIRLAEHLLIVGQSFIPRILLPDKSSSDYYYNTLAREAGIGNYDDETTSRKPDLISESIILGSMTSIVAVALVYGLMLVFWHWLISHCGIPPELQIAVVFTTLQSLGQMPYLAALIAACCFTLPFYLLCSRYLFQPYLSSK
jgi:hypothetical protein